MTSGKHVTRGFAITIRNNTDRTVVAVTVESGDEKDTSGVGVNGFGQGDTPPATIIEPYGAFTIEMPATNLLPGKPLKISGVMYGEETADGEGRAKERIRGYKERAKKAVKTQAATQQ